MENQTPRQKSQAERRKREKEEQKEQKEQKRQFILRQKQQVNSILCALIVTKPPTNVKTKELLVLEAFEFWHMIEYESFISEIKWQSD